MHIPQHQIVSILLRIIFTKLTFKIHFRDYINKVIETIHALTIHVKKLLRSKSDIKLGYSILNINTAYRILKINIFFRSRSNNFNCQTKN